MNVLEQAKLAVAERMIAAQHREIASLEIRNAIAQQRASVATLVTGPLLPFFIMGAIYALYCGLDLWMTHRKKGQSDEPRT